MKTKIIYSFILLFACTVRCLAQFVTGSSFFVKSQTQIAVDGLAMKPAADLDLSNKTIQMSHTAIPGSPASIQRVYTFNQAFVFNGQMGLSYLDGEQNGNAEADLEIGTSTQAGSLVFTNGSTVDQVKNYLSNTLNNVNLKVVSAASPSGALPVTLVEFKAAKMENSIFLSWKTSFEMNSDFFEIERSLNGTDWGTIGKVKANGVQSNYSFTHENPSQGENIYRLRMVDQDGSFGYSSLRSIRFDGRTTLAIYPNPVGSWLKITGDDWKDIKRIQIVSSAGKTVEDIYPKQVIGLQETGIPVHNMSAGIYVVRIFQADGTLANLKMLKQ